MNKYIVKIVASILFGIIYGFIVKLGGYDLGILVALINILIEFNNVNLQVVEDIYPNYF